MRRGTTPCVSVRTKADFEKMSAFCLSFKDSKGHQVNKFKDDFEVKKDGNTYILTAKMTQKDTLKFAPNSKLKIQIRYVDETGYAKASEIITAKIEDVLFNKELGGD